MKKKGEKVAYTITRNILNINPFLSTEEIMEIL